VNGRLAGAGAVAITLAGAGCAGHAIRVPDDVRGYEIVVPGRDSLSLAFAGALKGQGFHVRSTVRGGTRPAAALVHFVFQEWHGAPIVLYGRLADTRSGAVVAAAEIPLDSTGSAARDSVPALVRALSGKRS